VAQGFADRLIEPVRIAARFDIGRFRNAPPVLVEQVEAEPEPDDDSDPARTPRPPTTSPTATRSRTPRTISLTALDTSSRPPKPRRRAVHRPDPAAIRSEAIGHARAVVDLCRLAGQPQMAGRFLEEDASLDEVRAALLAAKAEAEPEIAPHHPQPGRSSAARPWGEIVARTFR
jgi:ATP-dependent Clp protease protease subunit